MCSGAANESRQGLPKFALREVAIVGVLVLIVHLVCIDRYSFFRDELYYLACADNLAWGYVDHPPLSVFILRLFTAIFGTEIWAVRLPGVLAGVASVFLYANIVRLLHGGVIAQALAGVFVGLAPVCAVVSHLYSMNGLDITFWALAVNLWLIASDPSKRYVWLFLGLVLGLAVLNKLSGVWLMGGLAVATLLTRRRVELKSWQLWAGLGASIAIASPYMLWQVQNGFPTLEFMENAAKFKLRPIHPWTFFGVQVVVTNPAFAIMWLAGFVMVWKNRDWRPMAIPFTLVLLMLLVSMRSRENYLAPAYAFIVPAGAIWLASWMDSCLLRRTVYVGLASLLTIATLGLALPIMPPETFVKVVSINTLPVPAAEIGPASPMQGLADMFGWRTMARETREVWNSLPNDSKLRTPVLGMNYGESSAIRYYNRDFVGLKVIGLHNNFWLWGPGAWDGDQLVVVGHVTEDFRSMFESWQTVRTLESPWAVPEEANAPISIARGLKLPVAEFWQKERLYR